MPQEEIEVGSVEYEDGGVWVSVIRIKDDEGVIEDYNLEIYSQDKSGGGKVVIPGRDFPEFLSVITVAGDRIKTKELDKGESKDI